MALSAHEVRARARETLALALALALALTLSMTMARLTPRTPISAVRQFATSQGFHLRQLGEVGTPAQAAMKLRELLLLQDWPQGREAYLEALNSPRAQRPALVALPPQHPPATAPLAPAAPAPAAAMRPAAPTAPKPGGSHSKAPRPAAAEAGRVDRTVAERLTALEESLLGSGAPPQGDAPVPRLAWLEAQMGGTPG